MHPPERAKLCICFVRAFGPNSVILVEESGSFNQHPTPCAPFGFNFPRAKFPCPLMRESLSRILEEAYHDMSRLIGQPRLREISRAARRQFTSFTTTKMDHSLPFEEERLPWYRHDQFYPVRIGETLDSRYKVLGKLGYGAHSTSWLCRNMKYLSGLPYVSNLRWLI